jgi:TonB family protein
MTVLDLTSNLIAFTIQTSVIVIAALVSLAVLRVSAPHVRYLLLRLVLAVCLLLPAIQPRLALIASDDVPSTWMDFRRSGFPLAWRSGGTAGTERSRTGAPSTGLATGGGWAIGILGVAGSVACLRLMLIGAGLIRLRRLRRAGIAAQPTEAYDDLQARVGARPQIRFVPQLGQPITFGARRAVVLLPDMLRSLRPGIQHAVVAHELWHVRRRDWLWVLGEEVIRSTLWFNPAILVLISRIQAAREEAVDELAILATGSRRNYLDALIAFADRPSLFAAAAFARRRHLVQRVLAISKESVMSSTRVVACCAVLAVVVASTSWYSVSAFPLTVSAQTPRDRLPPPPPPPPPPAGQFDEMEARMLKQVKERPTAQNYQILTTLYFERAFREPSLTPDQKSELVTKGLAAADQALAYDAAYAEAMIYKNLLLRLQAQLTTDPAERARAIAEADLLRARAMELRKQQPQTAPGRSGSMPPPPPPPPPPDELSANAPTIDGEFPIRVGGNIAAPAKIRDAQPVYPPEAQTKRIEGNVILEVTIDREGKVRNARILKSVPMLDRAALDAVRQWEFEPVLLNGAPKPVIMVVTVRFSLQ